ncbi:MAG: ATP-binding protein [Micromonosporaceae bacterium]
MRWLRVFPGMPAQVAEVRRFVSFLLAACPARDDLVLCASELAANAVLHTASGDGGFFSVEVVRTPECAARVLVTDAGGSTVPVARTPAVGRIEELEAGGLGLAVVAARASRWGYSCATPGRTVWAEVCWPAPGRPGRAGLRSMASAASARYGL